jgi:hypothetical protein
MFVSLKHALHPCISSKNDGHWDQRKDVEAEPKDGVLVTFPDDDGWLFTEDGTYWLSVMLSYLGKPGALQASYLSFKIHLSIPFVLCIKL